MKRWPSPLFAAHRAGPVTLVATAADERLSTAEGTILTRNRLCSRISQTSSRELPLLSPVFISFPQIGHCNAFFHIRRCVCGNVSKSHVLQTMARELDMIRLIAFRLSGRCAEPRVQRYRCAKQRNFSAVNAGATFVVRIAAVTPDACALQRLLPLIPSGR